MKLKIKTDSEDYKSNSLVREIILAIIKIPFGLFHGLTGVSLFFIGIGIGLIVLPMSENEDRPVGFIVFGIISIIVGILILAKRIRKYIRKEK